MNQLAWLLNRNSNQPMPGPSEGAFSPEDAAMMRDAGWFGPQTQIDQPTNLSNAPVSVLTGWSQQAAKERNALDTLFQGAVMGGDLDKATRLANTPEQRALLDVAYAQRINDQDRRARIDAGKQYDAPTNLMGDYARAQEAKLARSRMEEDRQMKIQQFYGNQALQRAQVGQIKSATKLAEEKARNEALKDPSAPKPPPDMRVGNGGEFEVIPNSKLDMKQKKEFAQNKDELNTMETTMKSLIDNIDQIIGSDEPDEKTGKPKYGQHPGMRGAVGYIDSKLFPFTGAQADARSLINSLKSKSSVEGLQTLRKSGTAPGSITEKEWPIFQNYIGRVDDAQGEDQYVQGLKDLRSLARERLGYVRSSFQQKYGDSAGSSIPNEAIQYLRANPQYRTAFDMKYGQGASAKVLGQ